MDIEELEEKLQNVEDEKVKTNIKHVFKVKEIVTRRLSSLEDTDYLPDEILLGTALAINERIKEVDSDRKSKLQNLIEKIINM